MSSNISFTIDVEDYAPEGEEVRAEGVIDTVLAMLDELKIRGTFFVVGALAASHRSMVRRIADGGHELALHGWTHTPLPELDRAAAVDDFRRGRELLEELSGNPVVGFRAPTFSLVPDSHWATEGLAEAGFTYSSSVLPARSPLFGDPTSSRSPFRWPSGLVELPCPVANFGPIANPYLGGAYLRVLPYAFVGYGLARARADELLWLYCHPYDFDPGEPFRARAELGRLGSRVMWIGRSRMAQRVGRVLRGGAAPPLCERAAALS